MVVASTSLAFTSAVSRASSSSRIPISCASLREKLALGLVRREAGDRFELAPLLVERDPEPRLLLADGLLAARELAVLRTRLVESPLELVELARELFLLRDDALLDLLDLALALPRLLVESRARFQRAFLGLEVGGLQTVGGVALGILDEALGTARRVADLTVA